MHQNIEDHFQFIIHKSYQNHIDRSKLEMNYYVTYQKRAINDQS